MTSSFLVLGLNTTLAFASEQENYNTLQNTQPDYRIEQCNLKVQLTKENVEAFLDDYFKKNMDTFHVPGAAVSVVKGNQELLTAAYGFSNLENQVKVDADKTTFPACSVTKLFTATAIMQLYKQGKLDLNADITQYVNDIKIKNSFQTPITCSNLLTHTSGLDEQSELAGSTLDINNIKSQSEYFKYHIPTTIRKPGTASSYSNMGYNLLGYIAEKVSGQSFEEYVQNNILKPLHMDQSSVRIDNASMAIGYNYEEDEYSDVPFAYQYTSGSSGVITTVSDMENFMIMHLNNGTFQENNVLNEDTEELMQQKQFANSDVFAGMGYGWIRSNYNDVTIIKHEGALPGYATTMILIPSQKLGIYVATNSFTGLCFDFEDTFLNYFYGEKTASTITTSADASTQDLLPYIGTYRNYDGIAQSNLMKLGILFDTTDMVVSKNKNGILKASLYNQQKELEETTLQYCGNGVFLRDDGKGYLTFKGETQSNKITYAFTDVSHCTYQKLHFYETKPLLIMGFLILFILFIWSIIMMVKITLKKVHDTLKKNYYAITASGIIITVLSTLFTIVLVLTMVSTYNYNNLFMLKLLLASSIVGVILMLFSIFYGMYAILKYKVSPKFRLKDKNFHPNSVISPLQASEILRVKIFVCFLSLFLIISVLELVYFNLLGIHIF